MSSYSVEAVLSAKVDGLVNGFKQAQSSVESFVSKNEKTFDSFKKVGAAATAGGVAIAAGLGGAVKVAANFEAGMSEVAAISGATGKDLQDLTQTARDWGASTSFSATEAAKGLEYMALAGWDTQQMMGGIGPVLHLAEAGAIDLGRASDLVTDSMAGLGLEVKDLDGYLDKVAKTAASSNTDIDTLMEAFVVAGGTFDRFNVPLEESNAFLGVLANRGFKGAEAGTAINAIMSRLTTTTGPAAEALRDMGVSAYDSEGNFRGMETVLTEVRGKLENMTDAEKANAMTKLAGLNHGKTFNAMLEGLGNEYGDLKGKIIDSDGALKQMRDTMKDNLQGAMENLSSAFEEIAISIGTALLPTVKKMAEFVQNLADRFNGLDEKTKTTIAVIATLAAGFLLLVGPIMMLIGFIPSMLAGFAALSTVAGAIGTALALITGPIALITLGLAAIAVGAVFLAKKMSEDAIPAVERFGEGVSEATQEAVGAFMDMSEKADVALKEIAWSQKEMTAEMAANMIAGQQEITDTLLTAIGERHTQESAATKEQFAHLDSLTEEQKLSIIQKTNERYAEEAVAVEEGNATIAGILQLAADEKRALTQAESDDILAIRNDMTVQAVAAMSESAEEQKLIYEKMKDNASTITALEAAEVVRNSIQKKEDVIDEAETQFTETRMWAERQRDELGTMSAEEAQIVIDEAKKKRDETVSAAEDMHKNVVSEAKSQADEHVELVDWETGEILSKWDVFVNDVKKFFSDLGKALADSGKAMWEATSEWFSKIANTIKEKVTEAATNMSNKTEEMKTAVREKFEDIKTAIREKLTDAVKIVGEKVGEMPGKVRDKISEMASAGGDLIKGLITGIKNMAGAAVEAITGVVDGVVNKAKSLLGIASPSKVFESFGEYTGEGFVDGIVSMYKAVKKAAEGLADAALIDTQEFDMTARMGGLSVPSFNGANSNGYNNARNSGSAINNARGDFKQTVIINSPKHTSPSENARLIKQQSRQLATEWGV